MSRSYKHNPYITDHSAGTKSMKRIANRRVRRCLKNSEDMPSHLKHRKMTESWDICDYKWRTTREEAIEWWCVHQYDNWVMNTWPTLESYLNYWEKWHRRK